MVTTTVPAGATTATIQAIGAAGVIGTSANELGASIQGNFQVTPGETLSILVGYRDRQAQLLLVIQMAAGLLKAAALEDLAALALAAMKNLLGVAVVAAPKIMAPTKSIQLAQALEMVR